MGKSLFCQGPAGDSASIGGAVKDLCFTFGLQICCEVQVTVKRTRGFALHTFPSAIVYIGIYTIIEAAVIIVEVQIPGDGELF